MSGNNSISLSPVTKKSALSSYSLRIFLVLFSFAFVFYWPTIGAGFTFDFVGIAHRYDGIDFKGLPQYFSQNGFLPIYHVVMFTMYKLFRLNGWPWFLLTVTLHSLVALLLFLIIHRLTDTFVNGHSTTIAFLSALLFLLNPLQTETVVWVPAIHYLICACLTLGCVLATLHYIETHKRWLLLLISVLQLIAHFTLEESLVIPVMIAATILLLPNTFFKLTNRLSVLLAIVLPQLFVLLIYFGIHYLVMGGLYSHNKGGGGDPFSNINLLFITSNFSKFLLKFITFLPYWKFNHYTNTLSLVERPIFAIVALVVLSAIFLFLVYRFKKFSEQGRLMFLLIVLFIVALAPVVNLPHSYIFPCQQERYGYFASIFLFPLLVFLSYSFLPKLQYVPVAGFLIVSVFCLHTSVKHWQGERIVREGLIKDFHWYDKEHVYILSLPESFHGVWMFQAPADSNMFAQFLEINTGKDIKPKTREVTQFIMETVRDSVSIEVLSDSVIAIKSACDGSWLSSMKGRSPNENFDFKTTGDGSRVEMTRKVKLPNSVYIYSVGDKWKEVAF